MPDKTGPEQLIAAFKAVGLTLKITRDKQLNPTYIITDGTGETATLYSQADMTEWLKVQGLQLGNDDKGNLALLPVADTTSTEPVGPTVVQDPATGAWFKKVPGKPANPVTGDVGAPDTWTQVTGVTPPSGPDTLEEMPDGSLWVKHANGTYGSKIVAAPQAEPLRPTKIVSGEQFGGQPGSMVWVDQNGDYFSDAPSVTGKVGPPVRIEDGAKFGGEPGSRVWVDKDGNPVKSAPSVATKPGADKVVTNYGGTGRTAIVDENDQFRSWAPEADQPSVDEQIAALIAKRDIQGAQRLFDFQNQMTEAQRVAAQQSATDQALRIGSSPGDWWTYMTRIANQTGPSQPFTLGARGSPGYAGGLIDPQTGLSYLGGQGTMTPPVSTGTGYFIATTGQELTPDQLAKLQASNNGQGLQQMLANGAVRQSQGGVVSPLRTLGTPQETSPSVVNAIALNPIPNPNPGSGSKGQYVRSGNGWAWQPYIPSEADWAKGWGRVPGGGYTLNGQRLESRMVPRGDSIVVEVNVPGSGWQVPPSNIQDASGDTLNPYSGASPFGTLGTTIPSLGTVQGRPPGAAPGPYASGEGQGAYGTVGDLPFIPGNYGIAPAANGAGQAATETPEDIRKRYQGYVASGLMNQQDADKMLADTLRSVNESQPWYQQALGQWNAAKQQNGAHVFTGEGQPYQSSQGQGTNTATGNPDIAMFQNRLANTRDPNEIAKAQESLRQLGVLGTQSQMGLQPLGQTTTPNGFQVPSRLATAFSGQQPGNPRLLTALPGPGGSAPPFLSPQTEGQMLPSERAMYGAEVAAQGFSPADYEYQKRKQFGGFAGAGGGLRSLGKTYTAPRYLGR